MRKSSLEQFLHSRVSRPVRLSNQPEAELLSRSNAASSTSKTSGIPRPRITSVEREMLVTAIPPLSSNRKHRQRSFSAESVYDYAHTPNIVIPGSSQHHSSHRTPMGSSCRSQSAANSVMKRSSRKDTRPLMDMNFQTMELAKIRDYFQRHPFSNFTSQELGVRSTTLKIFEELMSTLLKKLFPQPVINTINYTKEIPLLVHMLCNCGNVMHSWLDAENVPHSFPDVLRSVSWLINLLENTSGPLQYIEVEDLVSSSVEFLKTCVQYHVHCYNLWNEKNVEDFTKHDEALKNSLEQVVGTNPEYSNALDQELKTVKKELNKPKKLAEIPGLKALEEEFNFLAKQKSLLDANLHKVQAIERAFLQDLEAVCKQHHTLDEKHLRAQSVDLQNAIKQQAMSIADKEHMLTEMTKLWEMIKTQGSQCEEIKKKYDNDMAIARLREKGAEQCTEDQEDLLSLQAQTKVRECSFKSVKADKKAIEVVLKEKIAALVAEIEALEEQQPEGAEQCTKDQEDLLSLESLAEIEALVEQQPEVSQLQAEVTKEEESTNNDKANLTNAMNECDKNLKDLFKIYAEMCEMCRESAE